MQLTGTSVQIAKSADEIFDNLDDMEKIPQNVRQGFVGAHTGLGYMEEFFVLLFQEILTYALLHSAHTCADDVPQNHPCYSLGLQAAIPSPKP